MNRIEKEIEVTRCGIPVRISYVQSTNALPIVFKIKDYNIPSGSIARVYVRRPDGSAEYDTAVVSGNDVTVNVKDTMFSVTGDSRLQIRISKGNTKLVSFAVIIDVKKNYADGGTESENVLDIFDEALEEIEMSTSKAEQAAKDIAEKAASGEFTSTVQIGKVTTGNPGTGASVKNTGTPKDAVLDMTIPQGDTGTSMRLNGAWNIGVKYVNDKTYIDMVIYEGSTYGCKRSHTASESISPTNEEYWECIAKKGETGNIENIDTIPIDFQQATERANIQPGDSITTALGKLAKLYADLENKAAFYTVSDTFPATEDNTLLSGKAVSEMFNKAYIESLHVIDRSGWYYGQNIKEFTEQLNTPTDEYFTIYAAVNDGKRECSFIAVGTYSHHITGIYYYDQEKIITPVFLATQSYANDKVTEYIYDDETDINAISQLKSLKVFKMRANSANLPSHMGNSCAGIQMGNSNFMAQFVFSFSRDVLALRRKLNSPTWSDWSYFYSSKKSLDELIYYETHYLEANTSKDINIPYGLSFLYTMGSNYSMGAYIYIPQYTWGNLIPLGAQTTFKAELISVDATTAISTIRCSYSELPESIMVQFIRFLV